MALCPDGTEPATTFELPPVFLHDYPDLEGLRHTQARQTALAVYYHNRMIQSLFDSLSRGCLIRGLTETYVASILELIKTSLSSLGFMPDTLLLAQFIANERALFNESCSRWFDQTQ